MKAWGLAFMLAASNLGASTVEPWVGGTRPYETVSYREMNIELLGSSSSDFSLGQSGLRLDYGILDHWKLNASVGRDDAFAHDMVLDAETQARFADEGDWALDLGIYGGWRRALASPASLDVEGYGGLVVARELGDNSLSVNIEASSPGGLLLLAGYRSPYVMRTLRAGLEYEGGSGVAALTPQLDFNFPGDISLQLGASFGAGAKLERLLLSLSYEIFPSP